MKGKSRFALYQGNRGFFPASLQKSAREELVKTLVGQGHEVLAFPFEATKSGGIETIEDGSKYAQFLCENRGKYDGVILALPNFGDENGAMAAFRECDVPILIQAYPDDLDKMAPATRRDSFCGKMSIMDVFVQCGIDFTALKPHTVSPSSPAFKENVDYFDRMCRVVRDLRNLRVGALGARTTAFKTVRFDEVALQRHGVTTETYDLSEVFARMNALKDDDAKIRAKAEILAAYTTWDGVPDEARLNLARLGVVIDDMVAEYALDCVAVRCWNEMQEQLKVSPCVLASEMNERGVVASCELDVGNAIAMYALQAASGNPAACLDWNNNYGDDENKCILFHCGPVPKSMMTDKGKVEEHAILSTTMGPGCTFGCDVGRIKPSDMTYCSLLTRDGEVLVFLGEGKFTADPIPADFFGCAGVAEFPKMQEMLQQIGYAGFRHHVSVTTGHHMIPAAEAMGKYLGYEVMLF
ncbi:MAG: hypothetical protein LBJ46_07700 [Planctomycetota bacterium]|jgi:L-fucose isomerase-like protein|nr:hypothetical protein [Planctomycetota bacterium]